MGSWIDLCGQRFGLLVAQEYKNSLWTCQCDCGGVSAVPTGRLRSGNTKSCGCRKRAVLGESTTKHGKAGTRAHRIWKAMNNRCNNPATPRYKDYGGRGIKVCRRWKDFSDFLADMGEPPEGHSIERRKNNKGYSPANCYWASTEEQNLNKRNSIFVDGVPLKYWAAMMGVPYMTAYDYAGRK